MGTTRLRGVIMLIVGAIGIVVIVLDAADDGFSLWNAIAIACFVVVVLYDYLYLANRRSLRS
jgi:hypothetical protein